MEYNKIYENWLNKFKFDECFYNELKAIKENEKEIEDRFYKEIEFGTAGMRGLMGAGTNRINKYTLRKANKGLANYILKNINKDEARVVIGYDSRNMSKNFAEESARTLGANGIKTYLFKDIRTTPELSFAIRHLNCISGIMITASHNPKEYNGYKVYWEDGAQISSTIANNIIEEIAKIKDLEKIEVLELKDGLEKNIISYLTEDIDNEYIKNVFNENFNSDKFKGEKEDFKIIFTPLHGTSLRPMLEILKKSGFNNIKTVEEQSSPNGDFPTVKYPNPEDKESFKLAIALAEKECADLIMATDPDGDRIGVLTKTEESFYMLSGNQVGALLVDYILKNREHLNLISKDDIIIKTIVTSDMGRKIADSYGVDTMDVLTGFKYIGEKIKEFEKNKTNNFIFGYEESFGYLKGSYARDKDSIVTGMLIAEMASYYKSEGKNLLDALIDLYQKHGYFVESLKSITLEGKEGFEKISSIMNTFMNETITEINNTAISTIENYKESKRYQIGDDNSIINEEKINLPITNAIKFKLKDDSWVAVRPSGTEPKIKFYVGVNEDSVHVANKKIKSVINYLENKYIN